MKAIDLSKPSNVNYFESYLNLMRGRIMKSNNRTLYVLLGGVLTISSLALSKNGITYSGNHVERFDDTAFSNRNAITYSVNDDAVFRDGNGITYFGSSRRPIW